ncbi:TraB/GumN family protein [Sphingomicrobium arenosum]|uniref:TraB/GumN family protein n=1 Tax=Sphingomicrobium arenosum TaxID=2233861 RepID=UPI00223EE8A2|nr:TraB/GumN family protein [Sphingomicrobium arenosum]
MTFANRLKTVLATCAAATALAAAPAQAEKLDADPALWVVADEDTTIYLFGTFHFLDNDTDWFNGPVRTAYEASDELVIESLPPSNPAALQPVLMEHLTLPAGTTLDTVVEADAYATFLEKIAPIGIPAQALGQFEPTFAVFTAMQAIMPTWGLASENGADNVLKASAETDGKPVSGLETTEEVLAQLGKPSLAEQSLGFNEAMAEFDNIPNLLTEMKGAWASGDTATFDTLFLEMNDNSPESYEAIIVERNAAWTEKLAARLDQPGTVFVAVGAGHLIGDDGVQAMLAKKGITAERLQ